ncbi:MAG: flagellar hook-basal body protein [Verrucomicrobiota bacterium]
MNVGLYQAISGMKSAWENQQVIASNLARNSIPGHRGESVAFEVPESVTTQGSSENQLVADPVKTRTWINFQQGSLQPSNDPLHLAIQGDSFFSVKRADGSIAFTRNGEFMRSRDGKLIQSDGAELLMEGGASATLQGNDELTLSPDGTAYSGTSSIGKLDLVRFEKPSESLIADADGRFALRDRKQPIRGLSAGDKVMQGYLEKSNVEPVKQMVDMMEVMRIYEANQKMASMQDDTTGKLIRVVGGQ